MVSQPPPTPADATAQLGVPAPVVHPGQRPRFSIVSAVHNVARFLPDFIASIEKQYFDLSRVEVIAVDDGSTDDSLVVLKEWATRRPELVTVLTKPNGGQGSARNMGIEHAKGEWLTFTDPDDMLEPGYLSIVDAFLDANPTTAMIGTYRIFLMDETGAIRDTHPLRKTFQGDRLIDLNEVPELYHGSAPAAFFRADIIAREGLRFDDRIRPNFEDGHFCTRYLLAADAPKVGFLKSAQYIYRKRADGSSTLDRSVQHPGRYLAVPRYGYLDVLEHGMIGRDYPPEWVQNMVFYDLSYYFSSELAMSGGSGARGAVADEFFGYLKKIVSYLDPVVINGFKTKNVDRLWRDICLHGLEDGVDWHTPYVVTTNRDDTNNLVRVAYRYVGTPPTLTVISHGEPVPVRYGKVRAHEYFERTLMYERIAWVPLDGTLRVLLNGTAMPIQPGWEPTHNTTVRDWQVRQWFEDDEPRKTSRPHVRPNERPLIALAKTPAVRHQFKNAWVLMDRIHDADDNAERLFRYLRTNRPDINAWFVLEKDTPDWKRLERDGHGDRLVAHGTARWKLLMLNCRHLVSSHADAPIHRPGGVAQYNRAEWSISFLQHGVIKDDLSRWLNPKGLDLFVTSTPQEQESIVGDGTTYLYTDKEAKMTGLPRFDRLLSLGSAVPVKERQWILVCPTWRHWLMPAPKAGTQRYEIGDEFFDSEYAQLWTGFLRDERLGKLAADNNLRIGFLPHPNIQSALKRMDLPAHVQALTFAGNDVQQFIADAALMVTDYSSMSFNAAYLDRPVVYFQFDAERLEQGAHVGRPGYFQYERDGFGPVTATVEETIEAVSTIVTVDNLAPATQYQARIDATFTERDGRCCERTTAAIEALPPKSLPRDRVAETLKSVRANPRVQKFVRSQRGRELVPKLKRVVKDSGLRDRLQ